MNLGDIHIQSTAQGICPLGAEQGVLGPVASAPSPQVTRCFSPNLQDFRDRIHELLLLFRLLFLSKQTFESLGKEESDLPVFWRAVLGLAPWQRGGAGGAPGPKGSTSSTVTCLDPHHSPWKHRELLHSPVFTGVKTTSEMSGGGGSAQSGAAAPWLQPPLDGTGEGCFRHCRAFSWAVLSCMSEIHIQFSET